MSSHRTGHYAKGAKRLSLPGVVFAVHVNESLSRTDRGPGPTERIWCGAEVAVQYRDRAKWSGVVAERFARPDQMREWMEAHAREGYTQWVIADDCTESLTLSEWWRYAESCGLDIISRDRATANDGSRGGDRTRVQLTQLVCSERCGVVTYRQHGIKWRWLSLRNYWPDGTGHSGSAGGRGTGVRAHLWGTAERESAGGTGRASALLSRFRGLCDWWRRTATAPLGLTAGQLAWGVLRTHTSAPLLCTHNSEHSHRLERAAAHGGRASAWFVGPVKPPRYARTLTGERETGAEPSVVCGPVHRVDVSSMYPWLLRDRVYPVSLLSERGEMSVRELADIIRSAGVIARVRIRTEHAEYPLRAEEDVLYPTGEFTTTLAGPDLERLIAEGAVLSVAACSLYRTGRPFAEAMQALIDARAHWRDAGRRDLEALSKLVSTSLGGKLSQRQGGWTRAPEEDSPGEWGEWHALSTVTQRLTRYRRVAGLAFRWEDDKTGRGPHTAAFAYLTAYGRQVMRDYRALLPPYSCIAQDTDGLFLLDSGLEALTRAGMLARSGAGALRLVDSVNSAQFWTPRHYRWGKEWVLSGCAEVSKVVQGKTVTRTHRTPLFGQRNARAPDSVTHITEVVAFPEIARSGRVRPDGWIDPPLAGLKPRKKER